MWQTLLLPGYGSRRRFVSLPPDVPNRGLALVPSVHGSYLRVLETIHEQSTVDMLQQAYKVEELLAMRDSVSESAVSLEKFPDEEAIKGTSQFTTPHNLFTVTLPGQR